MPPLLLLALTAALAAPDTLPRGRMITERYPAGAESRAYRLYLPPDHHRGAPLPLLLLLHGCTQGAGDFAAATAIQRLADRHRLLVALPEQTPDAHPLRCWRWYEPAHQARGAGEPALLAGITRDVVRRQRVDPDRVYVAGLSAGAAMAVVLAATYPELYAAVGAHSGVGYGAARGAPEAIGAMRGTASAPAARAVLDAMRGHPRPVPLILFHGRADRVVHPRNAERLFAQWAGVLRALDPRPLARDEQHGESGGRAFTRSRLRPPGDAPAPLEMWMIDSLEHAWSGGSAAGSFVDPDGPAASELLLRFLLSHRLLPPTR